MMFFIEMGNKLYIPRWRLWWSSWIFDWRKTKILDQDNARIISAKFQVNAISGI